MYINNIISQRAEYKFNVPKTNDIIYIMYALLIYIYYIYFPPRNSLFVYKTKPSVYIM